MKVVPPMWSFGRPQIRALVSVSNVDRRAARLAFLGSCFPEVIRNRYGNVMSPCDSEKSEIQPNLHQVGNADHLLSTVVLCYCPTWPMAHVVLLLLAQRLWRCCAQLVLSSWRLSDAWFNNADMFRCTRLGIPWSLLRPKA